ncbi:MAG: ABC transporter permease [Bifidobacteriaceae bacterium]|nr:ABC transporter permease [Bifidobacteriaceae bacterium]
MLFLLGRAARLTALLIVLSAVVFGLLYLAPGDPARSLVGARQATPELLEAIRQRYHLDQPLWQQYGNWLAGVVRGDLGESVRTEIPVTQTLAERVPVTLELSALALSIATLAGLPLGVMAAKRHGHTSDRAITAVAGLSAPPFAIGLLLLYLLAALAGWFPVYGLGQGGGLDRLWHLALPAFTLALGLLASAIKISRAAMLREVHADYGLFALSRGVAAWRVTAAQLGNAALPIVTSTGLLLASLVSGTILVETTFAIGGIGGLLQEAVTFKDVPTVQGVTLVLAAFICVSSALIDSLAGVIDPRLRRRQSGRRRPRPAPGVPGSQSGGARSAAPALVPARLDRGLPDPVRLVSTRPVAVSRPSGQADATGDQL